jgi:menaquinone-specific isochorismate synthase
VLDTIRDGFKGACHAVHVDDAVSLLKVRRCQHLLSRVEGILTDDKWKWDALRTLHPTPAVGGFPNNEALAFIEAHEPFDRGWYAGPIGWVGPKTAEFAVGIRSGLLHGDALRLYAGAGIVQGSTAESEWDEIENKMGNFLSALTDDE